MAKLIKPDEMEVVVVPANGVEFSVMELNEMLGGPPTEIQLQGHLYLVVNGHFVLDKAATNNTATMVLQFYLPEMKDIEICGSALIIHRTEVDADLNAMHILYLSSRVRGRMAMDGPEGYTMPTDYPIALLMPNEGYTDRTWLHGRVENDPDEAWFIPDGGTYKSDRIKLVNGMLVRNEVHPVKEVP